MTKDEIGSARRRPATILDVAKTAGVSVGTVSRYLNGIDVREGKRALIEQAIEELRYSRNAAASAMRSDKSNLVALLVPTYDEFFAGIMTQLNSSLSQVGQVLLTHQHDRDPRALGLALQYFRDHRVNAVVTPGVPQLSREIEALIRADIPVILFNNDIPNLVADRVFTKNTQGSEAAMEYLVNMGHRRIAFIGGDATETSGSERLAGYRNAVRKYALPVDERYALGDAWSRHMAYFNTQELLELDEPPTAILAASIDLAKGVMDFAAARGLRFATDLSLIGFDDGELLSQSNPGITCIAQPSARIGSEIAQLVMAHIHDRHGRRYREIRLDAEVILRGSVQKLPV